MVARESATWQQWVWLRNLAPRALLTVALAMALSGFATADIIRRTFVVGLNSFSPLCTQSGLRPSVVVNGQFPGPTIYAHDGDTVEVKVVNNQSLPVTIHWHGILQQGSQWYDGVPGVTQCPIQPGTSFTQIFRLQGQVGTYWWHSHVAQLRNTLHGALVVLPSSWNQDPLNVAIENEFLLLGGDWFTQSPQQLTASISSPPFLGYPLPQTLHINGRTLCNPQYYRVKRRKWYRMRVINTAMYGSYNLQIQSHMLVLHEKEGGYLTHMPVKWLDVYPGQSYSVLIYTGQRPSNYWVVLSPRYDVAKVTARALGVLSYVPVRQQPPNSAIPAGPVSTLESNNAGPLFQASLTSPYVIQGLARAQVTQLVVLEMNLATLTSQQQVYTVNNNSLTGGSIPFLLADYYGNSSKVYSTTVEPQLPPPGLSTQKGGAYNAMPAVIPLTYGAWVQVVFQNHNPPGGLHPWHTHGTQFYAVAQGNGTFDATKWRYYNYNLVNPPYLNTVALFDSSWVAVRFQATNPGEWIVHCHLEQHADQGLGTVFKIPYPQSTTTSGGDYTGPGTLSPPPDDYPACTA